MGSNGQPSISLTPASIFKWIRLFSVYASIYVECHPSESAALFTYMMNIMELHRRHGGVAWRLYDERFRRIRIMAPELPWHLINRDVAMGAIHNAPRQSPGGAASTSALSPRGHTWRCVLRLQLPWHMHPHALSFQAWQHYVRPGPPKPRVPCNECHVGPRQASRRRCASIVLSIT